jgi:hypothetical protein
MATVVEGEKSVQPLVFPHLWNGNNNDGSNTIVQHGYLGSKKALGYTYRLS